MKTLVLIRHGDSDVRGDHSTLSQYGFSYAEWLSHNLGILQNTIVVCENVTRCIQTVIPLVAKNKLPILTHESSTRQKDGDKICTIIEEALDRAFKEFQHVVLCYRRESIGALQAYLRDNLLSRIGNNTDHLYNTILHYSHDKEWKFVDAIHHNFTKKK